MGAINYKTSDYITLGYNCNNIDYDDEFYSDFINDLYDAIEYALQRGRFYYFYVSIEPGYYEGFSLDIECNFNYCFDDWREKREAQKEVTQLKKFLLQCVNSFEMVACSPGWVTSYYDYKGTIKKINDAVAEMREHVASVPTWRQVQKEC